jgi:hypothetical protein
MHPLIDLRRNMPEKQVCGVIYDDIDISDLYLVPGQTSPSRVWWGLGIILLWLQNFGV